MQRSRARSPSWRSARRWSTASSAAEPALLRQVPRTGAPEPHGPTRDEDPERFQRTVCQARAISTLHRTPSETLVGLGISSGYGRGTGRSRLGHLDPSQLSSPVRGQPRCALLRELRRRRGRESAAKRGLDFEAAAEQIRALLARSPGSLRSATALLPLCHLWHAWPSFVSSQRTSRPVLREDQELSRPSISDAVAGRQAAVRLRIVRGVVDRARRRRWTEGLLVWMPVVAVLFALYIPAVILLGDHPVLAKHLLPFTIFVGCAGCWARSSWPARRSSRSWASRRCSARSPPCAASRAARGPRAKGTAR